MCGYKVNEVIEDVEDDSVTLVACFNDNFLTLNAEKCHQRFSGCNAEQCMLH